MKLRESRWVSLLFVCASMTLCLNATNAAAPKDKTKSGHVDLGIDTARVKTQTVLFVSPDTSSAKISVLYADDLTVLVSRNVQNGWRNVIQYSSGRQGWVLSNRLFPPFYTKHPSPGTVLTGVPLGTTTPPIIEVTNDTDVNLYLHLENLAEVSVRPHQTKSLQVRAGIFSFNAAAPNVSPDFGHMAFLDGIRYTLHFSVRFTNQAKEKGTLSPALNSEYNALLASIKRQNSEVAIEKLQMDIDKLALNKQADDMKADFDNVDTNRPKIDPSDQNAIDAFNGLVVKANTDLDTHKQLLDQFNAKVDAYNSHLDALIAQQKRIHAIEQFVNAR